MAWIETIPPSAWTGELGALRPDVTDPSRNGVESIMQIHSCPVLCVNRVANGLGVQLEDWFHDEG